MAVYRVHIPKGGLSAGNNQVFGDSFIQIRSGVNPNFVWTDVPGGHRTIVLSSTEVLAITDSGMTAVQKRVALRELVVAKALELGIAPADEAMVEMSQLLSMDTTDLDLTIRDV